MRKLFTFILALTVGAGTMFSGTITSGTCGGNVTWDLTNGVLTISGSGSMDGWDSSSKVPWASLRSSIESVVIELGVTGIGDRAFEDCFAVTSIAIPNTVTYIGDCAFYNCIGLTSLTIPVNVHIINGSLTHGCSGLKTVVWNAKDCYSLKPEYAWFGNARDNITSFIFGNEVETIPESLCSLMTKIKDVTIPNSVTKVEKNAFYNCTSLETITIGSGVSELGPLAFSGCSNVHSVTWNAKNCTPSVYSSFKSWTPNVTSFTFGNKVEVITKTLCLGLTKITEITIPNSVKTIEGSAFEECTGLTSLTIGNGVETIEGSAFEGCSGLTSVTIGNSVQTIKGSAFKGCKSLKSVIIPNNVTSIETAAFRTCTGLETITIGSGVTEIGNNAFADCTSLQSITCNAVVPPSLASYAFNNISTNIPVYVPLHSANAYLEAKRWDYFTNIRPSSGKGTCGDNVTWKYSKGVLTLSGNGPMDILDPMPWADFSKFIEKVVVDYGITSISASAFKDCINLTEVDVPTSLINLGQYAFSGCSSLESLRFQAVQEIPAGLCENCTSLKKIDIGVATSVAVDAFTGCSALKSFIASTENTVFYSDVQDVLYNVGMTILTRCPPAKGSFTFPSTVTSIRPNAFIGCYAPLSVTCERGVPPTMTSGNNLFANVIGTVDVYVPQAEIETYKAAWGTTNCEYHALLEGECIVDGITYKYKSDGTATVIASSPKYDGDIVIPSTFIYDDKTFTVTQIELDAFSRSTVTSVVIPESVTTVNPYAFVNCTDLQVIYCLADQTVPSLSGGSFYSITDMPVYVPAAMLDAYQKAWSGMSYIEGFVSTCADVNTVDLYTKVLLNPVSVAFVSGRYVYIQDETGSTMLYLNAADEAIYAGAKISGLIGSVIQYSGLPEVKPSNAVEEWTITPDGDEIYSETIFELPTEEDLNKLVRIQRAHIEAEFTTRTATEVNLPLLDGDMILRNQFKLEYSFDAEHTYDILAAVATNNGTMKLYFLEVLQENEISTGIESIQNTDVRSQKVLRNGQLYILHNGKMYNVQGQIVENQL